MSAEEEKIYNLSEEELKKQNLEAEWKKIWKKYAPSEIAKQVAEVEKYMGDNDMSAPSKAYNFLLVKVQYRQSLADSLSPNVC